MSNFEQTDLIIQYWERSSTIYIPKPLHAFLCEWNVILWKFDEHACDVVDIDFTQLSTMVRANGYLLINGLSTFGLVTSRVTNSFSSLKGIQREYSFQTKIRGISRQYAFGFTTKEYDYWKSGIK